MHKIYENKDQKQLIYDKVRYKIAWIVENIIPNIDQEKS